MNFSQKIFSVSLFVIIVTSTNGVDTNTKRMAELIARIQVERADKGWDDPANFLENHDFLRTMPDFQTLEGLLQKHCQEALRDFPEIAPSEISQSIVILALWSLPPYAYIKALHETVGYAESGIITNMHLLDCAVLPRNGRAEGVLIDNYREPLVKEALLRADRVFSNRWPQRAGSFGSIISGDAKRDRDAYRLDIAAGRILNPIRLSRYWLASLVIGIVVFAAVLFMRQKTRTRSNESRQ